MKQKNNALRTAAVLFILLMVTACLVSGILAEQAGIPHTMLPEFIGKISIMKIPVLSYIV